MRKLQKGSRMKTLTEDLKMALGLVGKALLAFLLFRFGEASFLLVLAYIQLRYKHQIVEQVEAGPDWPEGM